jgi:tetratricopeptide (TPR) repeat protein
LQFRPEVVRNAHLFWLLQFSSTIYCDETFRDAYKSTALTGMRFIETPEETLDQKIVKLEKRAGMASRERTATRWAEAQKKLADCLRIKGQHEQDASTWRKASEAYRNSIDCFRDIGNFIAAAELHLPLGETLLDIGKKYDDTNALRSASSVFHQMIEFFRNPPSSVAVEYVTASPMAKSDGRFFRASPNPAWRSLAGCCEGSRKPNPRTDFSASPTGSPARKSTRG